MLAGIGAWLLKVWSSKTLGRILDTIDRNTDSKTELAKSLIESEIEARRSAAEVHKMTAGYPEMRFLAFCIGAVYVLHLGAVGLDTVFKFGWKIPKFPAPMDEWEGMVLLSFFGIFLGTKAINAVTAIVMRIWKV